MLVTCPPLSQGLWFSSIRVDMQRRPLSSSLWMPLLQVALPRLVRPLVS